MLLIWFFFCFFFFSFGFFRLSTKSLLNLSTKTASSQVLKHGYVFFHPFFSLLFIWFVSMLNCTSFLLFISWFIVNDSTLNAFNYPHQIYIKSLFYQFAAHSHVTIKLMMVRCKCSCVVVRFY